MSEPETASRAPIDLARVRALAGPAWTRVLGVPETESTNADLLADSGAPDHSVLVAEFQVAGRGRLDRSWVSPRGAGLLLSVRLRPPVPLAGWGWLPLLTGVALGRAVTTTTGVATGLKWPNDLLAGSPPGKLAGILAQVTGDAVVIGIGLNVSNSAAELPVAGATSLALSGARPDRAELLAAILAGFEEWYSGWVRAGGDAEASGLAAAYRQACVTIGEPVAVSMTDGRRIEGTAAGVDADGRLQVDGVVGEAGRVVVAAGDVHHLRPAEPV